jgi:hypothetical protein
MPNQFGNNPYDNPQMGWGGSPNGQPQPQGAQGGGGGGNDWQGRGWGGYGRPSDMPEGWSGNTPMDQWRRDIQPYDANWQGGYGGGAPGRQGQQFMYNTDSGEQGWVDDPTGLGFGSRNGQASWIDPVTGRRMMDPGAIRDALGGGEGYGGGGGQGGYQYQGGGGGQVTPGEGYQGFDYESIGSGIDPSAVIAAQEYKLQEAMEGDMARAGGRAGASGFAMSTPYANQLGEAARSASMDRNALTMQYQYDAAQAQAQRDSAQQQQAAQLDFGGWQTNYGGDLQSQMFNQGQNFQENQARNQYGFANWQNQQNQQNQQNNMNQQLMAQLMGGLF